MTNIPITIAGKPQKKIAVFSHERSGTHFLLNALAENFGYIADPWWNLDYELGMNFHSQKGILEYLQCVHNKPVLNMLKSHHTFEFFDAIFEYISDQFYIFYIYRDPRDVMTSFWRLIDNYSWDEGPRAGTVGAFIRSAPCSAILRYQKKQEDTMLHRWETHVKGWLDASKEREHYRIMMIKYENLNLEFNNTIRMIGDCLGKPVKIVDRPCKDKNVIGSGKGIVHGYKEFFTSADEDYLINILGVTMKDLGYLSS